MLSRKYLRVVGVSLLVFIACSLLYVVRLPGRHVTGVSTLHGSKGMRVVLDAAIGTCYMAMGHKIYCDDTLRNMHGDGSERAITLQNSKDLLGGGRFKWFGKQQFLYFKQTTVEVALENHLEGVIDISPDLTIKRASVTSDNVAEFMSNLEVLFGSDVVDPRPGWSTVPFVLDTKLSFTRCVDTAVETPSLKRKDGKFKILQVADLHFSVGVGECRDEFPPTEHCEADPKTLRFLEDVLDFEKPDLVVLTGDQVMGDCATADTESALLKAVSPFIKRKIPYAMVWGNHDDEGSFTRNELSLYAEKLPYSLYKNGPYNIEGYGNYVLELDDITLYFLDTHKYSSQPKVFPGYDWIKDKQLAWLKKNPSKASVKMAFFHIPLPEYLNVGDGVFFGEYKEGVTAPKHNSGAKKVLENLGVQVVSVGHDHCNDYCVKDGLWLCYGGAAGEGGYAGYGGTNRRVRIYEIDGKTIKTWKRLQMSPDEKVDVSTIVD